MASAVTNITDIKNRIKEILIANTTTVAAFRDKGIIVGLPDNAEFKGLKYPICFITNDRELMRAKPFADVAANVQTLSMQFWSLRIIIMALAKDAQTVETELDLLQKKVIDALRDNFTLKDPTTGTDALVVMSEVTRIDNFTIGQLEGKPLDGRIIKFMLKEIS